MSIRVGTKRIAKIYVGTKEIGRIYVGTKNIFPGTSTIAPVDPTKILYGINSTGIYTINITNGIGTRVGNVNRFGIAQFVFPTGLTSIGNTLYGVSSPGSLFTIDSSTGVARIINASFISSSAIAPKHTQHLSLIHI